jgi:hypothetical protein
VIGFCSRVLYSGEARRRPEHLPSMLTRGPAARSQERTSRRFRAGASARAAAAVGKKCPISSPIPKSSPTLRAEMPARQFVKFCRSSARSCNLADAARSPACAAAAPPATPATPDNPDTATTAPPDTAATAAPDTAATAATAATNNNSG